jgi:hypothetical protein
MMRIPPLPPFFILKDRDDDTPWVLSFRQEDERFAIVDTPLSWNMKGATRTYEAFAGPLMDFNPAVRLLIRGGRLGYEYAEPEGFIDQDTSPIVSRKGVYAFILVLQQGTWLIEGDTIGYRVGLDLPGE